MAEKKSAVVLRDMIHGSSKYVLFYTICVANGLLYSIEGSCEWKRIPDCAIQMRTAVQASVSSFKRIL